MRSTIGAGGLNFYVRGWNASLLDGNHGRVTILELDSDALVGGWGDRASAEVVVLGSGVGDGIGVDGGWGGEGVEVVAEVLVVIVANPRGVGVVDEGGLVAGEDVVAYFGLFICVVTEIDDVLIIGVAVGEDFDGV